MADSAAVATPQTERVLPERLEPVPPAKSYFLSGLATLFGLSVLLGGYLMMTAGLLAGFFWLLHRAIVEDWFMDGGGWLFWLFLFCGPLLMILVYFMVSPIFGRRGLEARYLTLTERDQKRFFLFLKRLCQAMDAPMPDEVVVDCKANAAVRRIGPLRHGRLQLMIGMPLIEGLSALHFAGVIAHELAHFRQRGGRRLGYAIDSIGNLLETLAFHRGRSDRLLAERFRLQDGVIGMAFYGAAIGLVAAARKICQGMAWVGRLISSHHSRQLEYDADRWQARLVGNARFTELMREIMLLDVSCHRALGSLSEHEEENRFPVDLADYVSAFRAMLDEETEAAIWADVLEMKTGLFDSHPAARDRIANIQAFERNPSPEYDFPARELFRGWRDLCRLATRVFYCQALGEAVFPANLHTSEELLGKLERNSEYDVAHLRYFAGVWHWLRPLRVGMMLDYVAAEMAKTNVDLESAARRQLGVQRDILRREAARVEESRDGFLDGIGRLARARSAEHLRAAGAVEVLRRNKLSTDPQVQIQEQQEAVREIRRAEQALAAFEHATAFRLALALGGPGGDQVTRLREQAAPLVDFVRALEPQMERIRGILVEHSVLQSIENLGDEYHVNEDYLERRRKLAWGLGSRLKQIYFDLEETPFPLEEDRRVSVSSWLLQMPEDNIDSVLHSADVLIENLPSAVFRILGRLALLAEEIEKEWGLPPLELIPDQESED